MRLFDSGSVLVVYQVEQEPAPRRTVVHLNDDSPAYRVGDRVEVRYAPDAPARATIVGEENPPTIYVLAEDAAVAGAGAPLLLEVSAIGKASQEAWQPAGTLWLAGDPQTRRRVVVGLPDGRIMSLYRVAQIGTTRLSPMRARSLG